MLEKKRERERKGRNRKEKKKQRERKEERERKKERVREPWLHTNEEAAPLPFQAFAAPFRSTRPPRSIVSTHEVGVSHAIIATIPRNPSFMLAVSILR